MRCLVDLRKDGSNVVDQCRLGVVLDGTVHSRRHGIGLRIVCDRISSLVHWVAEARLYLIGCHLFANLCILQCVYRARGTPAWYAVVACCRPYHEAFQRTNHWLVRHSRRRSLVADLPPYHEPLRRARSRMP